MMDSFRNLVWLNDPLSPIALALMVLAALSIVAYGFSFIRVAGWKHGVSLLALRSLAIGILAVVLLQPARVTWHPVSHALPESLVTKQVRLFGPEKRNQLLPPLSVLSPPAGKGTRDIELQSAKGVPLAYFKGTCPVVVTVDNGAGTQLGDVVVRKVTADPPVEVLRKPVTLKEGKQQLHLELVPDEIGKLAYSVHLEGFTHNESQDNDTAVFSLVVTRESLRVLHIAGHPSWDVRFVRQFLTSIPGVELISFYLLVQTEDFAPHSKEELALIPFPTDELFIKEIGNFDVVVVHNFPLGTYFLLKEEHLSRMKRFVEEGGALLFIGGDEAYQLGAVETTPISEILPVDLTTADKENGYASGSFAVEPGTEGLTHPVTTIQGPEGDRPLGEQELPMLPGANLVGEVRPEGVPLLWARNAEDRVPLLVAGNAGRGRVLVLATDTLWRWAFPTKPSAVAPGVYRELLWNCLAWLSRDPRMEGIRLEATELPAQANQEIEVEACPNGMVAEAGQLKIDALWTDALGKQPGYRLKLSNQTSGTGCTKFTLPAVRPGAWKLDARLESQNRDARGTTTIAVERLRKPRYERIREAIQPITSTLIYPFAMDPTFEFRLNPDHLSWKTPHLEPVWNHFGFFVAFALMLLMEWVLRKRWGYL